MFDSLLWFQRFTDIPGLSECSTWQIDPSNLPGFGVEPEVHVSATRDSHKHLMWKFAEYHGSASPASQHCSVDRWHLPVDEVIRNLHEVLELPGTPTDYHFAIQGVAEALWGKGRKDPVLDSRVEELCWLDIYLVEACPEAVSDPGKHGKRQFVSILSFYILIEMYERRGRLSEALSVAESAASTYDQCQPQRWRIKRKVDTASGKPFKREVFIPAKVPPQHPYGGNPGDSGWSALAPDGPHGGSVARWYYWWDESHQKQFEGLWSTESDRIADDLADEFGFAWPWLIGEGIAAKDPQTFKLIEQFSESVNDGRREKLHASSPESVATWGAFQLVRQRRTWHEPVAIVCPVCGKEFWTGDVTPWAHKKFGPARYCMDCCLQSRVGNPRPTWTKDEIVEALRQLHSAFSIIPQQAFAYSRIPYQGSQELRDGRMRALVNAPNVQTIKDVLEQDDWLMVLRAAGLVGAAWRPSRGTWCHANDGHKCRSLLEKSIDDWLSARGIAHECEPRWPRHPVLNPSGAKRADWGLSDGTYIECAGMMEDPAYVSKIAEKRKLADLVGIRLVIITPTDIDRLDDFFKD